MKIRTLGAAVAAALFLLAPVAAAPAQAETAVPATVVGIGDPPEMSTTGIDDWLCSLFPRMCNRN